MADFFEKVYQKRRQGEVGIIVSIYYAIFFVILMGVVLQLYAFRALSTHTEDALAASNLSAAVIDIKEYGTTHNIVIEDSDKAYDIFKKALKINMGLDESMMEPAIAGSVEIVDFIIYNVKGTDVEVCSYGQNRYEQTIPGGLGSVAAPNGIKIESTSIYSRVTFPVEGIMNIHVTAVKDKLVDVVVN